jgi:sRNA-binding regulator protein Hfq
MRTPAVFTFVDGTQISGLVLAFGRYSIAIIPDGGERQEIIYKHAIKHMRRAV